MKGKVNGEEMTLQHVFLDLLRKRQSKRTGVKELCFFSDQCADQNKNQFIAYMYYLIVALVR